MIIMALDHVRDFFSADALHFQPDDLARTTTALFFTRWVTHICAPVFMFAAGIAAFLWWQHGKTLHQLSVFLWKRGLWLVFLELTALRFAEFFSLTQGPVVLTVLWALGWSMVALGFLVHLPVRVLAVLSVLVISMHNLADPLTFSSPLWNILHQPGFFVLHGIPVVVGYPLIPWFAVMSAGFCFGRVVQLAPRERQRWMIRVGLVTTLAFLVIRGINGYGDPVRWSGTLLSFLRCTKYPPSLDFLTMTLGPALLLLAWFDTLNFGARNPLIVFGRVPLFYFIVHFFVAHLLAFPLALLRYGRVGFLLNPYPTLGGSPKLYPADYGYSLWAVYLIWISVVLVLYPLCVWYGRLKERRRDWWLSYL
jgi:uncharacterized membrane protein